MSEPEVDILVVNRNTLPWLKLQHRNIQKFRPKIGFRYHVWENDSFDGSQDFIRSTEIVPHFKKYALTHGKALDQLIPLTTAPIICLMDVDAFPFAEDWLDEAVRRIQDRKIGAAGHLNGSGHTVCKKYVHPSFMVFFRETYEKFGGPCEGGKAPNGKFVDTSEHFSINLEKAGLDLSFVGWANWQPFIPNHFPGQKVAHLYGSGFILSWPRPVEATYVIWTAIENHRKKLGFLGLWDEFMGYIKECAPKNPCCKWYTEHDPNVMPPKPPPKEQPK
jgi:hypothetical protein